jgi:hypothetical protein
MQCVLVVEDEAIRTRGVEFESAAAHALYTAVADCDERGICEIYTPHAPTPRWLAQAQPVPLYELTFVRLFYNEDVESVRAERVRRERMHAQGFSAVDKFVSVCAQLHLPNCRRAVPLRQLVVDCCTLDAVHASIVLAVAVDASRWLARYMRDAARTGGAATVVVYIPAALDYLCANYTTNVERMILSQLSVPISKCSLSIKSTVCSLVSL